MINSGLVIPLYDAREPKFHDIRFLQKEIEELVRAKWFEYYLKQMPEHLLNT